MEQHPVPQNITSYQFRLIGDMTLKQFLELVAGGLVGLLFYATNLPGVIKWAFILLSVITGAAFAFMPVEERPLDRWILAFIKACYRPLQFVWKKSPTLPDVFTFSPKPTPPSASSQPTSPTSQTRPSLPTLLYPTTTTPKDQAESQRLDQVLTMFSQVVIDKKLPTPPPTKQPAPVAEKHTISKKIEFAPTPPVKITPQTKTPTPQITPITTKPLPQPQLRGEIHLNQTITTPAKTNPNLPFPSLPEQPNILVGMILDHKGGIVENAIIEIKDAVGYPVRATKSNKLGQFFSATPLKNGTYTLETEKGGLRFTPLTISLTGKVYQPLEIRAQTNELHHPQA